MRSHRAKHDIIGVSSAYRESAINKEQDIDLALLVSMSTAITLERKREHNEDELTGLEEANQIYDNGATSSVSFDFEKLQPQHAALALAYGLGDINTTESGGVYTHTITPLDGDVDAQRSLPSLTAVQRFGKTVMTRRFASLFADNVSFTFAKDDWVKGKMDMKGTGKYTSSVIEEVFDGANQIADNATSITLANAVDGSDAAGRMDAVHGVRRKDAAGAWHEVAFTEVSDATPAIVAIPDLEGDGSTSFDYKVLYSPRAVTVETINTNDDVVELTLAANAVDGNTAAARLSNVLGIEAELSAGVWTPVEYSAVSDAEPAVITITAPGSASTAVDYRVTYHTGGTSWRSMPDEVQESPLRVSQVNISIGGTWDGSTFTGGKNISFDVNSVEYSLANSLQVEFTPGAEGAYASRVFRDQRTQTLKLNKQFRDYMLQNYLENNEYFGVHITAEGATISGSDKFLFELVFPKCGLLGAPVSVDGKRLAEAGDLHVLDDGVHGSVIAKVVNEQAQYAAVPS